MRAWQNQEKWRKRRQDEARINARQEYLFQCEQANREPDPDELNNIKGTFRFRRTRTTNGLGETFETYTEQLINLLPYSYENHHGTSMKYIEEILETPRWQGNNIAYRRLTRLTHEEQENLPSKVRDLIRRMARCKDIT